MILYKPKKSVPLWFKLLSAVFLCPILAAPLVFYGSVFIFDNPSNMLLAYLLFFAVNAYSLVLIIVVVLGWYLYRKHGRWQVAIIPHLSLLGAIGLFVLWQLLFA